MKVNLLLKNKIICEKERLFVNTKSVWKPYFTFQFFANIELSPHFLIWCYQFLSVRPNQKYSRVIYLEFRTCFILYDDEVSFFENLNFSNAPSSTANDLYDLLYVTALAYRYLDWSYSSAIILVTLFFTIRQL